MTSKTVTLCGDKQCPHGYTKRAACFDCLTQDIERLRAALKLLIEDVQDYPAWQRPCLALDKAKAALFGTPDEQQCQYEEEINAVRWPEDPCTADETTEKPHGE
jgi:hypothetical protein